MSRPRGTTKLESHPEEIQKFLARLSMMPITTACMLSDISFPTYQSYMQRGKEEKEGPFREFLLTASRARGEFKARLEAKAIKQDPKWMLANTWPEEYSNRHRIEMSGELRTGGDPFNILKDKAVTDALDSAISRRAEGGQVAKPGSNGR